MQTAQVSRATWSVHARDPDAEARLEQSLGIGRILARVLDGYDYVVKTNGANIEVIVLSTGTPRQAVAPVPLVHHRSD